MGLAFDGDGDRLGVVTPAGEIIAADKQMMLFAIELLSREQGATVIYDVKCTKHLADIIAQHGGNPQMCKTGHSLVKAKMKALKAALAGEMSGHLFFKDRWYGFDDALYAGARLLEILASSTKNLDDFVAELPQSQITPEIKIQVKETDKFDLMARFKAQAAFPEAQMITIDGVRAEFKDGWGLLRPSNTTPNLILRFEGDTPEALSRIQTAFRTQLQPLGLSFE